MKRAEKARKIGAILDRLYPQPDIPLGHRDPFTLLVAVVLSAQTTDAQVNRVTPALFRRASTVAALAQMPEHEILKLIRSCGLAPSKARRLKQMSRAILDQYGGHVPRDMEELEKLPGVGHKSAGVVMTQAFGEPAFSGRHAHSPAGRALGSFERQGCQKDRSRPKKTFSAECVGQAPPADHLLRKGVLPGAESRPGRVPDLLMGGQAQTVRPLSAASLSH